VDEDNWANVSTIATYQTLSNPERLKKFDPSRFKLVIVDEAHHAAALS
jgi:ATP-dependent helicase IRC3